MDQQQAMQTVLNNWQLPTITSLEMKQCLIATFPQFFWKQQMVSDFLSATDLPFDDNGTYKTYVLNRQGFRFSRSKGNWYEISEMATPHLKNALLKDYSDATLEDIFSQTDSEAYIMLKELMSR